MHSVRWVLFTYHISGVLFALVGVVPAGLATKARLWVSVGGVGHGKGDISARGLNLWLAYSPSRKGFHFSFFLRLGF